MANTDATMLEVKVDALPEVPSELIGIEQTRSTCFVQARTQGTCPHS